MGQLVREASDCDAAGRAHRLEHVRRALSSVHHEGRIVPADVFRTACAKSSDASGIAAHAAPPLSFGRHDPRPGAQPPQPVAHPPGRQAQIVLADELQAADPAHPHRVVVRDIPAIEIDALHPLLAEALRQPMQVQIEHVILDHQQPRAPTLQVEAREHVDLMPVDINRNQVDRRGDVGFDQDIVEGADRNRDGALGLEPGDHELIIERGMPAREMQRHGRAGPVR